MAFENISYPFETTYSILNTKLSIAAIEAGKQSLPKVLFLHGMGSNCLAWKKNIAVLSEHFHCIALDLPGYGKSSKTEDFSATMRAFANCVVEFLEIREIKEVYICGHSMGGQIALWFAYLFPNKVKKMALLCPAGFETFTAEQADWIRTIYSEQMLLQLNAAQIDAAVRLNFFEFPTDAEFMIQDRVAIMEAADYPLYCKVVTKALNGMLIEPIFEHLPEIKTPCLVFFGENDKLIPSPLAPNGLSTAQIAEIGTQKLPNAQLELLPNCGHFIPFEAADRINPKIINFFQDA